DDLFGNLAEKLGVDTAMFSSIVSDTSSGAMNFNSLLPGDESPREITVEVIASEDIESRTLISSGSNARIQENLNSISLAGVSETLSIGGQMWPAIGVYVETSDGIKIEVVDGSRRRKTCILEGKPFSIIVFHGILNFQQRRYLKNISNSGEEHTYFEQCLSLYGDFQEFLVENPSASKRDFAQQIGMDDSTVRKQLIVAVHPVWIYMSLAKDAQNATLVHTTITPMLRRFEEQYTVEMFKVWLERAVRSTFDATDENSPGHKLIPRSLVKGVLEGFTETLDKLDELPDGFIAYIAKKDLLPEVISDYLYPIYQVANTKGYVDEVINEFRGASKPVGENGENLIPTSVLLSELEMKLGSLKEAGMFIPDDKSEKKNNDIEQPNEVQAGRTGTHRTFLRGTQKEKGKFIRWDVAKSGQNSLVFKGADNELLNEIKLLVESHLESRETSGKKIFGDK
ncbi:hypothetical protein LMH73_025735, partial [Vibrio splendidus]